MKLKPKLITIFITLILLYGVGRLYFYFTDGFSVSNIASTFSPSPSRETRALSPYEKQHVDYILSQKFTYLGKGCQSYVFLSEDKNYVLKFFKYQRFYIQPWMESLSFIPFIKSYKEKKLAKKHEKLNRFFVAWKVAFDELQKETGLVFVHLNKTSDLNKTLSFTDKMGFSYNVNLDDMEFMVQKKAEMLCPYLKKLIDQKKLPEAKLFLNRLTALISSEYSRGFADHDHALMQNTGVFDNMPIHIDVGQFAKDETAKDSQVFKQHLFNKMYKFRAWLAKESPELNHYLEQQLVTIIGSEFYTMQPHFIAHDEK